MNKLSPEEQEIIVSLRKLYKKWPKTLKLEISNDILWIYNKDKSDVEAVISPS